MSVRGGVEESPSRQTPGAGRPPGRARVTRIPSVRHLPRQRSPGWLIWLPPAIPALALVLLAAAYLFVQRTLPLTSGSLVVTGLKAPVQVVRDQWGVPHVYATTEHDLFFTQGYVTAQDRLFQMEQNRRVAAGRLSEIFGNGTLETDVFLRTIGIRRAAEAEAVQLDPTTRSVLQAYADGVNAFVDTHRDRLPLEFTILGFTPEPWSPADSLAWGKVMAWDLGGNHRRELLRAALLARFGPEATSELLPGYPVEAPLVIPSGVSYDGMHELLAATSRAELAAGLGGPDVGSNNWVVHGSRTTTGMPLLANDPHLGIQMPSVWYEVHLTGAGWNVAGASLPGTPGVVIGHNDSIAWGVTNLGPDVQDLYLEKVNPDNPRQVLFQGQWEDTQLIRDEVRVRGQSEPERIEIVLTRHGPLINTIVPGLGQPTAFRWTALEPTRLVRSIREIDRARNWSEFRQALANFDVPGQNFVYADVEGNIGYQATGKIPIRAKGDGLLPAPGWTGEYEWVGYVPFDQMPSSFNPPAGFLATANNRIVGDSYPYSISKEWDPGFRAARIVQLLSANPKVSMDDVEAIQNDEVSLSTQMLLPLLARASSTEVPSAHAIETLRQWDGRMSADSVAASIYQVIYNRLLINLFASEMGPDLFAQYRDIFGFHVLALPHVLGDPHSPWMIQVRGPGRPSVQQVLDRSVSEAVDELTARLGPDQSTWRWGRLHTATFEHPLGEVRPLDRFFNLGPFPRGGSNDTLNNTGYTFGKGYAEQTVSSLREVIDLSSFDQSELVITTGQSGQPFSSHMGDQAPLWVRGQYHRMPFSRPEVDRYTAGRLELRPG